MKRTFINGQCHIFDEARTVAEAILVENGRIAKFGSSAEIKEAAPDAEFVELNGRILLPGFNDSHMHFLNYGFYKTIVDRIKTSYNWRDLHDLGIVLGMGTDCPVESFNPLPNIYSAVTRKDLDEKPEGGWYPQQALTLDEALEGYTKISAYLSRDEKIKGTLEVGMLADMVVLEENLYTCKPEHIKDIRVDMTIVNGEIKYSRN